MTDAVSGSARQEAEDADSDEGFQPLTREEATSLRRRIPALSLWRVVMVQAFVAVLVAALAWVLTGRLSVMLSAGYGGLSVVVPAAMLARALSRQAGLEGRSVLAGLVVWELAKVGLTVAMLLLAPRVVMDLSWLALVAGFVVTMKVYWLALWLRLAPASTVKKT